MPSKNSARRRAPRGTGQRTRTGCGTCKARRVKCDEAKPFCRRCVEGGHQCEGYAPIAPPRRTQSRSPPAAGFTGGVHWTERERRSIEHFRTHMVPALTADFGSAFWSRHVLELARREAAVKHALAALGSQHEAQTLAASAVPSPSDAETAARHASLQQYNCAIRELSRCMTGEASGSKPAALACCLVLVALESLQGNSALAMEHLTGGIRIYRSWSRGVQSPTGRSVAIETPRDDLDRSLFELFYRLDSQATGFLDTRHPELVRLVPSARAKPARSPSAAASVASSINDAATSTAVPGTGGTATATDVPDAANTSSSAPLTTTALKTRLEDVHKDVLIFLVEAQPYRFVPRQHVPTTVSARLAELQQRLSHLGSDVDTCAVRATSAAAAAATGAVNPRTASADLTNNCGANLRGALMLRLARRALAIMLNHAHTNTSDDVWTAEHEAVCDEAERILNLDEASTPSPPPPLPPLPAGFGPSSPPPTGMSPIKEEEATPMADAASPTAGPYEQVDAVEREPPNPTRPPRFTLEAALVPALLLTARGAPLTSTRERAARLLRRANLQEGLWSSAKAADIADKCLADAGLAASSSAPRSEAASFVQLSTRYGLEGDED